MMTKFKNSIYQSFNFERDYENDFEEYSSSIYDNLPNNESAHPYATDFSLLDSTEKMISQFRSMIIEHFLR